MNENGKSFDASRYLTKLKGKDYLEVKWRLLWLRTEHPEASISTELHTLADSLAVFKATVRIPGAGEATGWGSETAADFGDYIEKAETKALGRALAMLGYGTQFATELEWERDDSGHLAHVADSPVERPAAKPNGNGAHPTTGLVVLATPAQVKAIYTIGRNEHQRGEEELDDYCRNLYGVVPAQLSKRQASELIDKLKANGVAR